MWTHIEWIHIAQKQLLQYIGSHGWWIEFHFSSNTIQILCDNVPIHTITPELKHFMPTHQNKYFSNCTLYPEYKKNHYVVSSSSHLAPRPLSTVAKTCSRSQNYRESISSSQFTTQFGKIVFRSTNIQTHTRTHIRVHTQTNTQTYTIETFSTDTSLINHKHQHSNNPLTLHALHTFNHI